jgi:2-polyprenyl-3-methyl-5-hydroxy-6-metoxy-1,4-benzoquinol methylase
MLTFICADSTTWEGQADAVLSNPYAPIPKQLHGKPMLLSLFEGKGSRLKQAEAWIGGSHLSPIGFWGAGGQNVVYVANMPIVMVPLSDLMVDPPVYMPLGLPLRLLDAYWQFIRPGMTVFDGCCGRGTVGLACKMRGLGFVGIDKDHAMIDRARAYCSC